MGRIFILRAGFQRQIRMYATSKFCIMEKPTQSSIVKRSSTHLQFHLGPSVSLDVTPRINVILTPMRVESYSTWALKCLPNSLKIIDLMALIH